MKKLCFLLVFILVLFQLSYSVGILPYFYGPKSLAMGMGTRGFNFSINALHLNPAVIGRFQGSFSGYQFMNSYRSRDNFDQNLEDLLSMNFKNFSIATFLGVIPRNLILSLMGFSFGSLYHVIAEKIDFAETIMTIFLILIILAYIIGQKTGLFDKLRKHILK